MMRVLAEYELDACVMDQLCCPDRCPRLYADENGFVIYHLHEDEGTIVIEYLHKRTTPSWRW